MSTTRKRRGVGKGKGSRSSKIRRQSIRPLPVLIGIRARCGSAVHAAMACAINADEYMLLEKLSEH